LLCRNSAIKFTNNNVYNNYSEYDGGGLHIWGSQDEGSIISHNIIYSNSTGYHGDGGGLILHGGGVNLVSDNLIKANSGSYGGGGIYCVDSSPIILRNLIINNVSPLWTGGGIRCVRSGALIINNTINSNAAYGGGGGGGIYFYGGGQWNYPIPVIINNIISNSLGNWGILVSSDTSIIHYNNAWNNENGDISVNVGVGNISANPLYLNESEENFSLSNNSPCIDTGIALFILYGDTLVDLPNSAFNGNRPDMGAFESPYTVGIDDEQILPNKFALYQNYPNPFNPLTTISYQLPQSAIVNLSIYNITGQLIETLVNSRKSPGYHSVQWNINGVGSGMYFYKITAGEYSATGKCLLLK